jgi:GNAT superfamily N-acetyltransferase
VLRGVAVVVAECGSPNLRPMSYAMRPARAEDVDSIAGFTQDTFHWGDYVAEVFPHWVNDEQGRVMVAVDENDTPVAMSRGVMMSNTELWLQGARVSEEWRRRGIASALGESLIDWARERGARVARLLTEGWNEPAQRQVEQSGFRRSADWVMASRPVADREPIPSSNGGQRAKARRRLETAHSSEADPAWVSWQSGPLARPARGLHVDGWRWSWLTVEDLQHAGKNGRLWTSQAGWLVTRHDDQSLYIEWLECGPDDIEDMIRSIVDLAIDFDVTEVRIIVPAVAWLTDALTQTGFDVEPLYLFERAL